MRKRHEMRRKEKENTSKRNDLKWKTEMKRNEDKAFGKYRKGYEMEFEGNILKLSNRI